MLARFVVDASDRCQGYGSVDENGGRTWYPECSGSDHFLAYKQLV